MKRTEEEKELVKRIKRLPEVISFKRLLIFLTMLIWLVLFIYTLTCGDKFYIIPLVLLPLTIPYILIAYNREIDKYLKNPETIKKLENVRGGNTSNRSRQSNNRGNTATNIAASYAIGRTVQQARKQNEIAKYGVRTKGCLVISQQGREVTFQPKCDACGTVFGNKKTTRLNPSQKMFFNANLRNECPNCKSRVSVELLLTRK